MVQKRLWFWLAALVLWGLLRGLVPLIAVPIPLLPIAWLMAALGGVALLIWLASEVGKVLPTGWSFVAGLVAVAVRIVLTFLVVPPGLAGQVVVEAIADTLTLSATLLLGSSISVLVRHANLIPPVTIVLTVVDIWTVWLGGFVARVQQKAQEGVAVAQRVVEAATIKVPTVATANYAQIGIPVIGVGDLFFAAFLFATLWRFALDTRKAFILSILFVVLGLMLAQLPFVPFGVPGLPFIALAILLPNLRAFKYTPEEKKALLIGAVFLIALLVLFSFIAGRV
ncbi:MAG: hypothetical protein ACUVTP_04700 [Candidatus Fervidibacter sp.]|uniref:hypothetical protein n=1 Tax=Candidatus Fervidibacter sp. TaxID=3100871 RepID=UPI0040492940